MQDCDSAMQVLVRGTKCPLARRRRAQTAAVFLVEKGRISMKTGHPPAGGWWIWCDFTSMIDTGLLRRMIETAVKAD